MSFDENHFHNCVHVRESEKSLLVPVSIKGIAADHENWVEQRSIKTRLVLIFNSTILFTVATIVLRMVKSEETRMYWPAKIL